MNEEFKKNRKRYWLKAAVCTAIGIFMFLTAIPPTFMYGYNSFSILGKILFTFLFVWILATGVYYSFYFYRKWKKQNQTVYGFFTKNNEVCVTNRSLYFIMLFPILFVIYFLNIFLFHYSLGVTTIISALISFFFVVFCYYYCLYLNGETKLWKKKEKLKKNNKKLGE